MNMKSGAFLLMAVLIAAVSSVDAFSQQISEPETSASKLPPRVVLPAEKAPVTDLPAVTVDSSTEDDLPIEGVRRSQPGEVRYELLLQYAKANMDLAEVELQQMLQIVRKAPGAVPRMTIERLESNLAVARKQYDEANLASADSAERVRLRHAQEKFRLAMVELTEVQRSADEGVIDDLELKRVSLRFEMARLNLELAKNPEAFLTLLPYLESKVNRLIDEILELDKRLSKIEPTAVRYRQ